MRKLPKNTGKNNRLPGLRRHAATVSRWEAGQRMGASAERLLRLAVSVGTPVQDYSLDHLATDLSETTEHVPMRFECADDAWRLVA